MIDGNIDSQVNVDIFQCITLAYFALISWMTNSINLILTNLFASRYSRGDEYY